MTILQVVLDAPLLRIFDYRWGDAENLPPVGSLVQVPFRRRSVCALVVGLDQASDCPIDKLRDIESALPIPPLGADWLALARFAADYYQRPLGEVALPALPKTIRQGKAKTLARLLTKPISVENEVAPAQLPVPTDEQQAALEAIFARPGFAPSLLFGVTGSGKTEVYLRAAQRLLEADAQAQVLMLVPEINLTPQFEARIRMRFPGVPLATLHSGLAEGERAHHWLAAHRGCARILLGTRLAVFASLPQLALIVVDEEHDASYKQQEGLRYSARDLAVWRAHQRNIPVVLGSATPSLESWRAAQLGRYARIKLRDRAVTAARLPTVQLLDTQRAPLTEGLSAPLLAAMEQRLEKSEQSLLYLNRRGFAPVLACDPCGWLSACPRCTAFMVWHKSEGRLRCHHCALEQAIPRHCPTCGNVDLQPLGRGTQRIEETLAQRFPQARIKRIDADSTRTKGSAQAAFDAVHAGEVDILVGTQMVAKGHDFQRLTLVGIMNPDTALFSQDFRAAERLFAQLMQVSGRAGRAGGDARVLVQTRYPEHPLYGALLRHDFEYFAATQLAEREAAAMPPFMHQAILRADAKTLDAALDFLTQARAQVAMPGVVAHDPIPMTVTRLAARERAQLLVESRSRAALQSFLKGWLPVLYALKTRVRWALEVDPVEI